MQAIFNYGAGELRLETVPTPKLKEGRVLLKVLACGICGGEYHLVKTWPGAVPENEGVIPGHELVGEIVETTHTALPQGMRVVVSPNEARCGVCANCRKGWHTCLNWPQRTVDLGGGYAEYALIEPRQCHPLPQNVDSVAAALTEPLACCLHAARKVNIQPGERVIIVGAGVNAQLFIQIARLRGAAYILVLDTIHSRHELAEQMGADRAIDPEHADPLKAHRSLESGADVVIVTRGKPEFVSTAISLCDYGGRVLCYGVALPGMLAQIEPHVLWRKEIAVIGSRSYSNTFPAALDLIGSGRIRVTPLITRTIKLEETIAALHNALHQLKTVIVP